MKEIEKDIFDISLLYSKDEDVKTFLVSLEKINTVAFFTNIIKENNLFLTCYKNIHSYGSKGLKMEPHDTSKNLISYLSDLSLIISKSNKWEILKSYIEDMYYINLSIDNINDSKFKVKTFDENLMDDKLYLLIVYLKSLSLKINILLGEKRV